MISIQIHQWKGTPGKEITGWLTVTGSVIRVQSAEGIWNNERKVMQMQPKDETDKNKVQDKARKGKSTKKDRKAVQSKEIVARKKPDNQRDKPAEKLADKQTEKPRERKETEWKKERKDKKLKKDKIEKIKGGNSCFRRVNRCRSVSPHWCSTLTQLGLWNRCRSVSLVAGAPHWLSWGSGRVKLALGILYQSCYCIVGINDWCWPIGAITEISLWRCGLLLRVPIT